MDNHYKSTKDLTFLNSHFLKTFTKAIFVYSNQPTFEKICFWFVLCSDDLNGCVFVDKILSWSDVNALCTSKTIQFNIKSSFIVGINESYIFSKSNALTAFTNLHDDNARSFTVTFVPLQKLPSPDVDQACIKLDFSAIPSVIESLEFEDK